jgi:hypothetical protein
MIPQNTEEIRKKRIQNLLPNMGKGRMKGTLNKFTTLKDSFLYAFEKIGGKKGLAEWAKEPKNRGAFYAIVARMLPAKTDIGPLSGVVTFRVKGRADNKKPA